MKEKDGWKGIYCHWDGYPEHNGKILVKFYTNPKKIAKLISLGDISTLAPEIGKKGVHKNFNEVSRKYVKAYHRDRGDPWKEVKPKKALTVEEAIEIAEKYGTEYAYFWDGKQWNCYAIYEEQWIFGKHPETEEVSLESLEKLEEKPENEELFPQV